MMRIAQKREEVCLGVKVKALEGEPFIDRDDVHVYGPFNTTERLEAMLSSEQMAVGKAEREQMVLGRGLFVHYLLNANFQGRSERAAMQGVATNGTQL